MSSRKPQPPAFVYFLSILFGPLLQLYSNCAMIDMFILVCIFSVTMYFIAYFTHLKLKPRASFIAPTLLRSWEES